MVLVIVFFVLVLIIAFFVWYYFFGEIGDLKKAKKEFEIFGLSKGFVPQGLTFDKTNGKFLMCGYIWKLTKILLIFLI